MTRRIQPTMARAPQSGTAKKAVRKAAKSSPAATATGPSPVEFLDGSLRELEATLPVCRADPTKKAVHKLREAIRTVEAALSLFAVVKGLPKVPEEGKALLEATHELRRRAGRVRDNDVFEKLLETHEAEIALDGDDIRRIRDDCRRLREACHERRKRAAGRLVRAVESRETAVAAAAEALRHACRPHRAHRPPAEEIMRIADRQFRAHRELSLAEPSDDDRHEIRKAARQARLQLNLTCGASAAAAAERLHDLQRAGGDWHDWLELAALAMDELGPHRAATRAIAARRDRCLRAFEEQIAAFRTPSRRTRKPAA